MIQYQVPDIEIDPTKKIIVYIDLKAVYTGFHKADNIILEVDSMKTTGNPDETLIQSYKSFLNNLYSKFKYNSPFFVTFFDDGNCGQNTMIDKDYKSNRVHLYEKILDDEDKKIYKNAIAQQLKDLEKYFTKDNLSKVFYLRGFESDFVPFCCIYNNAFDSKNAINLILSTDKDLLQTCQFGNNVIQCTNRFMGPVGRKKRIVNLYNNETAVSYLTKKEDSILTSKYIPLILSLWGDAADGIKGINRIGIVKSIKLICDNNLPPTLSELEQRYSTLPSIIKDNFELIRRNMMIIDFEEQLKRTKELINESRRNQ